MTFGLEGYDTWKPAHADPMDPQWIAPEGQVFVCACCGRKAKRRDLVGDESCFLNAELCHEDSLTLGADGRVLVARGVERPEQMSEPLEVNVAAA